MTERAYRTLLGPGATVVDVGAWIGPTAMFVCACRAARILAVEPNPACRPYLEALAAAMIAQGTQLVICPTGVHAVPGEVDFGTASGEVIPTSGASMRGRGVRIQVNRLPDVLAQYGFDNPALVKIDIEGAEFVIADQIRSFAVKGDTRVFRSLHPGFEPMHIRRSDLLAALAAFDLYDDSLKPIAHDVLAARVNRDEALPEWGTEYGNFFEILLVPRGEPVSARRA